MRRGNHSHHWHNEMDTRHIWKMIVIFAVIEKSLDRRRFLETVSRKWRETSARGLTARHCIDPLFFSSQLELEK